LPLSARRPSQKRDDAVCSNPIDATIAASDDTWLPESDVGAGRMDFITLAVVILPIFLIGPMAEARGRSTRGWLWLYVLLLGPIAVLILWLLPPLGARQSYQRP
jgi:hypothetical protein